MTEFGVFFIAPPEHQPDQQSVFDDLLQEFRLVEELGFHAIWVAEHHFDNDFCLSPSPNLLLAAAATHTKRVKLGCGINVLPFHHATRQAEEGAMIDRLSHGRFQWGIGRGITGHEFPPYGLNPSNSRQHFNEMHEAVTEAWRTGQMSYDGEFVKVPPTAIAPRPVQSTIPVWVTAQSPESVAWGAARDYPVMQIGETLDRGRQQAALYRKAAAEAGTQVVRGGVVPLRQIFVADTDERARAACAHRIVDFWHQAVRTTAPLAKTAAADAKGYEYWKSNSPEKLRELTYEQLNETGVIMTGSPQTIREAVQRQIDALQCKHIMLDFWRASPREERVKAMRLFAEHVIPAFK